MKLHTFMILLTFAYSTATAGIWSIEASEQLANEVMVKVAKGEFSSAIDLLKPHWPLPEHEVSGIAYKIKQQQPVISERFGKSLGWERACVQTLGDSWVRFSYLQKYEKHALLWRFDFYKPKDEWVVNEFAFHDRWQSLYGEQCSNN